MIFFNPEDVLGPKDFIEKVQVIFNGGENSVSIARITWEGNDSIGIRWNVARREWDDPDKVSNTIRCVGMPSSRGYPVWFILPNELFQIGSELQDRIRNLLESIQL